MIDGLRLAKYLYDTGLKVQEFWLLYAILCLERVFQQPYIIPQIEDNVDFNRYIKEYFTNQLPDVTSDTSWSQVAFRLADEGWLEVYQAEVSPLKIESCKVTDRFRSNFFVSTAEDAFMEWYNIYPKFMYVKENRYMTADKSIADLVELYNTHILKHNSLYLHERCMAITNLYIKDNGGVASYKISEFFKRYELLALTIEAEQQNGERAKKSTTGRRAI